VSGIKLRIPQSNVQWDKTYDNRTEEIQLSQRTTYRNWNHRSQGQLCYRNGDRRASVTRRLSAWGGRSGDANKAQGRIQMGSKSGTAQRRGDDCGVIKEALAYNKIEIA